MVEYGYTFDAEYKELEPSAEPTPDFLVPPVRFAFIHLDKPFDVAMVGQVVAATGHVRADMVGQSIEFGHPKVVSKLKSWNISEPEKLLAGKSSRYDTIDDLRLSNPHSRLIGAVVAGGLNPFRYEWQDDDIIVIGGANGLSARDVDKMDATITIPTPPEIDFLTVSTVVSSLAYHILTQRSLWERLDGRN
jgi:hypothetical protein